MFLRCGLIYAADTEVQDLTDITGPLVSDDLYIVDNPDVTPASKKISVGNLLGVSPALDTDGTITDDYIDSADYAAGSIDAEHLAADVIDETKIADNGIDSEHYNDGSIDAVHLAADVIDETKIADNGIDSEHYNDDSIDAAHIDTIGCGTNCTWNTTTDSVDVDDAFLVNDAADTIDGSLTITTGNNLIVGTTTLTSSDELDGTKIKDADYGDVAVSAGGAWTLDGDCVDESHIADNGIDSEHYNDDSIDDAHLDWGNFTTPTLSYICGKGASYAGTVTLDGLTIGNDEIITFGAATLRYDSTRTDILFDNDILVEDKHPSVWLIGKDTGYLKAFGLHYHPGEAYEIGFWEGTPSASGINLTHHTPLWGFDSSRYYYQYDGNPEIATSVKQTAVKVWRISCDPGLWYDSDGEIHIGWIKDEAPSGIIIDEWRVDCQIDPDVEMDLDLCYADDVAYTSQVVVDVLDTTDGTATEDTDANILQIPNGKFVYLLFGADPEGTCVQLHVDIWYHLAGTAG